MTGLIMALTIYINSIMMKKSSKVVTTLLVVP